MTSERSHSRATGVIRLSLALWLIYSAVRVLADPQQATLDQGLPMSVLLPVAGLSFTLGAFLLTGFMSRIAGTLLACLCVWQVVTFGFSAAPIIVGLVGVYLTLRGGGSWAMDIYVQRMQERVRRRDLTRERVTTPESWRSPFQG